MSSNVLPDAFIVAATYTVLQLLKPFLLAVVSHDRAYQNNFVRAVGYVITYILVCVNWLVVHPLHWTDLWGLLPIAGALYGTSMLLYHVQDDGGAVTDAASPVGVTVTTTPLTTFPGANAAPPSSAPVGPSVSGADPLLPPTP